MNKAGVHIFFFLILLLFVVAPLWSSGMQEDPIKEAMQLVEDQRYDEAMVKLSLAVQEDPERLMEAADIVRAISRIRGEYNEHWRDLIASLRDDPDNSSQAMDIIRKMEDVDQYPNPRISRQIRDARRTVRFRYNQTEFVAIMEEAAAMLDRQEYSDSLQRYASGFGLFREEFEEQEYGNIFENQAFSLSTQLQESVDSMNNALDGVLNIAPDMIALVDNNGLQQLRSATGRLEPLLEQLQTIRTQVVSIANGLERANAQIPSLNSELEQEWYLVFLNRYALGRRGEVMAEGIAGVPVRVYQDILGSITAVALEVAAEKRNASLQSFDNSSWQNAVRSLQDLDRYAAAIQAVEALFIQLHERTGQLADTERVLEEREPIRFQLEALRYSAVALAETADGLAGFTFLENVENKTIDELIQSAREIQQRSEAIRTQLASWDFSEEIPRANEYFSDMADRLNAWDARFVQTQQELYTEAAVLQSEPLRVALEEIDEVLETAISDLEGREAEGVLRRFPQNALPILQNLRAAAAENAETNDSYIGFFQLIPDDVAQDERLIAYSSGAAEQKIDITNTRNRIDEYISQAENAIRLANQADAQGRALLRQARTQLERRDVERARSLLSQADSTFIDSLEIRYDEQRKLEYQRLISTLGEEILQLQTVIVIEQVRQRINGARELFQRDDFLAAEQLLQEAQNLWDSVNPGQVNREIRNLLGLVRAALNLQTNREIAEGSPLYYTLIPYLNRANENFQLAVRALGENDERSATNYFDAAEENINAVISAQPFNQEARVLQLRIQQQVDPQEFQDTFRGRFEGALDRRETDPQEALVDLQDLAAIQPDYPGMDNAIYQLEIQLGLRQAPIDRAAINASQNLTQRARGVAAGGSREQLQAAVRLLEEAVELYPDNQDAVILLDRYRIAIGGQVSVSITYEAQQRFRQAESLFLEGDIAASYSIVLQLLQSEANQRYTPLIDLEQRLKARLGI